MGLFGLLWVSLGSPHNVAFHKPRKAQRSPKRPTEARRGPKKPREAQRDPKKPGEAERPREAQRGPERPREEATTDTAHTLVDGFIVGLYHTCVDGDIVGLLLEVVVIVVTVVIGKPENRV